MNEKSYYVIVKFKTECLGQPFGPFTSRERAEQCLIEISKRSDVQNAFLQEKEDDDT